jgi:predicted DNA binding CopG/RHH family protein
MTARARATERKQMERKQKKEPIPAFRSIEEEAHFWDTHSLADYWDEFKPARVRFAKNLSKGLTIRLDPQTLQALRERAKEKGIGPTTLARMWILERLRSA